MQNTKTFLLFTDAIEHSFAHTEVVQASLHYEKVVLVVLKKTALPLPSNVQEVLLSYADFDAKKVLFKHSLLTLTILSEDLFGRSFNLNYYKTIQSNLNYLLQSIYLADKIEELLMKLKINSKEAVFLSFWFNTWAIALSVLKKQNKIQQYFSRAHGTDLFEYRVKKTKRLPFRKFQLNWVNAVFSVSQNGANYLKQSYPQFSSKIKFSYLGSADMGSNAFDKDVVFTVVSCATVRNIKRIFLIPEILMQLDFPVRWVHLGDENLNAPDPTKARYIKNKESLKNHSSVMAEFHGHLTNEQIFQFYKTNSVNLFLSVSETEGLPVSIMEAISFGIPVMATDVGGCNEIATTQTGYLLPKDFAIEEAANLIREFRTSSKNSHVYRKGVREFWKSKFEVTQNYLDFFSQLNGNERGN
jgi:glycosyltransferase involved in cell wall biosynthesis